MIDYEVDGGIATITWNVANRPMNVMNQASLAAFDAALDKAFADDAVKGVIIASARPAFHVGADLEIFQGFGTDKQAMYGFIAELHARFRRIEKGGKPFAAAINGHCLGGGLEMALACHYRVASDNQKTKIGLPEAKVGLLPGAGGTVRLPRMLGAQKALPLLLEGKELSPTAAAEIGIVDKVVPADNLLAEARRWLVEEGPSNIVKPWDKKGFKTPGGDVRAPHVQQVFTIGNAMLHAKTFGNYPAQEAIMSIVYEGLHTDIDNALKIETRWFVATAMRPEAANMTRFFFSMTEANKLGRRPKDAAPTTLTRVGMLGAGMMGAGIAYVTAAAGLGVVLLDTSDEAAAKGKAYSEKLVAGRVKRGRMSQDDADALLSRIHTTTDFADLKGCDLMIEAVFEDRAIKADVTRKAEAVIADDAVFASNTSTLPITGLAEASGRPANFIGLHFFSPVDRMPLVEIIRGKATSDDTLAKAMDYVKAIRKTPIVVNDSRGFFTSRVFATYVREGLAILGEGVSPALIDNAGRMAGMPVGPLALADEVSIELMHKVGQQTAKDLGDKYVGTPADDLIALMVDKLGRLGKKNGKGFYDYPEDGKKQLWPGLAEHFPPAAKQPSVDDVIKRLVYIQSVETARCMEENVVTDPRDADVGSIMGWGYPAFRGGVLSQIDMVGIDSFVEDCDRLAQQVGPRFAPPKLLRDMAANGRTFYPKAKAAA
ncbi:MAG: 3-hydroxyacyl-CoA dehydrogenase NAD-binding domain-containing protein [Alphaproteobacteria bacterium]